MAAKNAIISSNSVGAARDLIKNNYRDHQLAAGGINIIGNTFTNLVFERMKN